MSSHRFIHPSQVSRGYPVTIQLNFHESFKHIVVEMDPSSPAVRPGHPKVCLITSLSFPSDINTID